MSYKSVYVCDICLKEKAPDRTIGSMITRPKDWYGVNYKHWENSFCSVKCLITWAEKVACS